MKNEPVKNYTVARNYNYKRDDVGTTERHNERKNETYSNDDILRERSEFNYYFKKPELSYLQTFDKLCDDEVISKRLFRCVKHGKF